jgi:hypothetical protein
MSFWPEKYMLSIIMFQIKRLDINMKKIIYQLTVKDIQEVANQELERELSLEEIELIRDRIADKIPWYDAIAESIDELIVRQENQV